MTKQFIATALFLVACTSTSTLNAFVIRAPAKASTKLFLEDWVADMIDSELYRQGHMKDFEAEWFEKNCAAVLSRMETDFMPPIVNDPEDFRMHQKDKRKYKLYDQKKFSARLSDLQKMYNECMFCAEIDQEVFEKYSENH